jgi:hypothetical protein
MVKRLQQAMDDACGYGTGSERNIQIAAVKFGFVNMGERAVSIYHFSFSGHKKSAY